MKIMYLVDFGFDIPTGSNHLLLTMLDAFLNEGHEVHLVQSRSVGKYPSIPTELEGRENFSCDIIEKPVVTKSNFVKRYLLGIKYEFDAWKQWKKKIADMDIVVNHSHFTSPYTALLLKKYKRKTCFNIYDIFPGEAYSNGNIKSKLVYNVFAWLQKFAYRYSDLIFTLTEDTKQTLIGLGVDANKIEIIPNWFDETKIYEVDENRNTFAQEFGMKPEIKYVQYAGTLGISYDFDMLLDVAKLLMDRKDIAFQIVGEGIFLDKMKQRVLDEGVSNVMFVPWQPMERLSEVYSACTLQIVPLRKDVIWNSYPSKILPLMACSRVAVVSVEEDTYFYNEMNREEIGIATSLGNCEEMAESILKLIDNPELRKHYENNAKSFVYEKYSAKKNTDKMLKAFHKILEG